MKKTMTAVLSGALIVTVLTGCGGTSDSPGGGFDPDREISVVSRESGSGTRTAFIELLGIEVKGDDGTKKDMTTKEAIIADKTDVMMTTISGDPYAIGYISLGSLNDSVKALSIGGAAATVENVKNGSYMIQRPFNIATKGDVNETAQDFINFILSKDGQEVVSANKYIPLDENASAYSGGQSAGRIVIAGSSSVDPVMQKLREAYITVNPGVEIEIQTSDSSAGMTSAMNGTCDIGMASRALKDSELAELTEITIAIDGIAVIVNNANTFSDLTAEQVRAIFTGESEMWSDIK